MKEEQYYIIGAGISGLLAGYYLKKAGHKVTIFEASDRAGGLIESWRDEFDNLVQFGPHLCRVNEEFLEMCHELSVELIEAKSNKKYILSEEILYKMPLGGLELVSMFFKMFKKAKAAGEYSNALEFANYHFGKVAAEKLINPMLKGIYGVNLEKLDIASAMPKMIPREKGSLIEHFLSSRNGKSRSKIMASRDGFSEITQKLVEFLKDGILYNKEINGKDLDDLSKDGKVILTCPAYAAAKLLEESKKWRNIPELEFLREIKYSSLSSINVIVEKASISKKIPEGIGFLNSDRDSKIFGMLFNSSSFDKRSGRGNESYSIISDMSLSNSELRRFLLQFFGEGVKIVNIYRKDYKNAVPIYSKAVTNLINMPKTKGLILFGNYTGTASISGLCTEASNYLKLL